MLSGRHRPSPTDTKDLPIESSRGRECTVDALRQTEEVDGGVKAENVAEVVRRGARVVVAGSAIFVGGGGIRANTAALRAEIARASQ